MAFGLLAAAASTAISAGVKAAANARKRKLQQQAQGDAAAAYGGNYRQASEEGARAAQDAAMHQQLTASRGSGTMGSQAAAQQAAMQRAPQAAAQAQLAGSQIGAKYAGGVTQQQGVNTSGNVAYEGLRDQNQSEMLGMAAQAGNFGLGMDMGAQGLNENESGLGATYSADESAATGAPGFQGSEPDHTFQPTSEDYGGVTKPVPPKSDVNVKSNIQQTSASDVFRQTPGYSYDYKPEFANRPGAKEGPQAGIMAQDLEKTPAGSTMVSQGPDGVKSVDTQRLPLLQAAAMNEQIQRTDALEQKLAQYESPYKFPEAGAAPPQPQAPPQDMGTVLPPMQIDIPAPKAPQAPARQRVVLDGVEYDIVDTQAPQPLDMGTMLPPMQIDVPPPMSPLKREEIQPAQTVPVDKTYTQGRVDGRGGIRNPSGIYTPRLGEKPLDKNRISQRNEARLHGEIHDGKYVPNPSGQNNREERGEGDGVFSDEATKQNIQRLQGELSQEQAKWNANLAGGGGQPAASAPSQAPGSPLRHQQDKTGAYVDPRQEQAYRHANPDRYQDDRGAYMPQGGPGAGVGDMPGNRAYGLNAASRRVSPEDIARANVAPPNRSRVPAPRPSGKFSDRIQAPNWRKGGGHTEKFDSRLYGGPTDIRGLPMPVIDFRKKVPKHPGQVAFEKEDADLERFAQRRAGEKQRAYDAETLANVHGGTRREAPGFGYEGRSGQMYDTDVQHRGRMNATSPEEANELMGLLGKAKKVQRKGSGGPVDRSIGSKANPYEFEADPVAAPKPLKGGMSMELPDGRGVVGSADLINEFSSAKKEPRTSSVAQHKAEQKRKRDSGESLSSQPFDPSKENEAQRRTKEAGEHLLNEIEEEKRITSSFASPKTRKGQDQRREYKAKQERIEKNKRLKKQGLAGPGGRGRQKNALRVTKRGGR